MTIPTMTGTYQAQPTPRYVEVCRANAIQAAERAISEPPGFFREFCERQARMWARWARQLEA